MDEKQSGPVTARAAINASQISTAIVPDRSDNAWTPARGLRLRRAASLRLPALACGHRDPLDCLVWPEPYEGDYWADCGADRTIEELSYTARRWWS